MISPLRASGHQLKSTWECVIYRWGKTNAVRKLRKDRIVPLKRSDVGLPPKQFCSIGDDMCILGILDGNRHVTGEGNCFHPPMIRY